jgi:ubiquinone/menaquinone biosynthesis C-methylase UbiE
LLGCRWEEPAESGVRFVYANALSLPFRNHRFSHVIRYMVFFSMEMKSRAVQVAGIRVAPNGAWMVQVESAYFMSALLARLLSSRP